MFQLTEQETAWVDEIWEKLDKKLKVVSEASKDKLPYTTINGIHDDKSKDAPDWWTNGFWPGLMWLMYVGTKDEHYRRVAEHAEELLDVALKNYRWLHHDVGFMWHISAGVNYRLFGGEDSFNRVMFAASTLASRYNDAGKFIRAWNGDNQVGWVIIDCMMNIPLLYWASDEMKDPRFRYIAMNHADTAMHNHIRPDGSAHHILTYNPDTGELIGPVDGQGYTPESSWSRGQAWALYGFILSYIHTGKQEYLDTAKRVAHYFISCVCDDFLPKCDFRAPAEPVIYDTTAGACAACGLLEIANCVPEYEKPTYLRAAMNMLRAMEAGFCDWTEKEQSILQGGSEAYHRSKHHIPIIYGDYYFAEAIYKLKGFDMLFW